MQGCRSYLSREVDIYWRWKIVGSEWIEVRFLRRGKWHQINLWWQKIKQIISKYTGEPILSLSMSGVHERKLDGGGKMPATFRWVSSSKEKIYYFVFLILMLLKMCRIYAKLDGITSPAYSQYEVNDNNSVKYYYYYYLMIDNNKVLVHFD